MKLYLPQHHTLNLSLLEDEFEIVERPYQADYAIAWKNDIEGGFPLSRTIMCQTEPPVTTSRRRIYAAFHKYHTVLRYAPSPAAHNEFSFSDRPHLYPYRPPEGNIRTWARGRLDDVECRGIFFAGKREKDLAPTTEGPVLYGLRSRVAAILRDTFGGSCLGKGHLEGEGTGWPGYPSQLEQIVNRRPAYVLAFENFRLPGYITEKFWSGILSDRPTIYYGAPDITEHVDPDAFIDISPAIDGLEFDEEHMLELILSVDVGRVRRAARVLVDGIGNQPNEEMDFCTRFVIDRISRGRSLSRGGGE